MNVQHDVTSADDGIRLDRWFKRHYPALTHALLEKALRKGDIRLEGAKAKSSERVKAGQRIEIRSQDSVFRIQVGQFSSNPESRTLNPATTERMQRLVLYKDKQVIALNKPAGLAVQGGSKLRTSLDAMLDALRFEASERPRLVHRLDKDTSGVLLIGRSASSTARLAEAFADKTASKTYLALVLGTPQPLQGTIELPLKKIAGEGDRESVMVDYDGGKYAATEYRVLDSLARKFALVELKPLTGRTHQLRVHMQALGCPILGDPKYGGACEDAAALGIENRLHLHAWKLEMPAVAGNKALQIKAPLPPHMEAAFAALELALPKA